MVFIDIQAVIELHNRQGLTGLAETHSMELILDCISFPR